MWENLAMVTLTIRYDISLISYQICWQITKFSLLILFLWIKLSVWLTCYIDRDLELNRSSSAVSMSCDNSDYSYAQYGQAKVATRTVENMTELLEEPVEEAPQQVGLSLYLSWHEVSVKTCCVLSWFVLMSANWQVGTFNNLIIVRVKYLIACNYLNKSIHGQWF